MLCILCPFRRALNYIARRYNSPYLYINSAAGLLVEPSWNCPCITSSSSTTTPHVFSATAQQPRDSSLITTSLLLFASLPLHNTQKLKQTQGTTNQRHTFREAHIVSTTPLPTLFEKLYYTTSARCNVVVLQGPLCPQTTAQVSQRKKMLLSSTPSYSTFSQRPP